MDRRPSFSKTPRMTSTSRSSRTSDRPVAAATPSRVMSSEVGPRPPVTITASDRPSAVEMTSFILPALSPTVVWK
jgi:hypothetical protein